MHLGTVLEARDKRHRGAVLESLGPSWILYSRIQKPKSSSLWRKLHFKPEARWRIRSSASTALRSQSAPMGKNK
eukprot:436659-Pyramimonas_sp.AAC.1